MIFGTLFQEGAVLLAAASPCRNTLTRQRSPLSGLKEVSGAQVLKKG